MGLNLFRPMIYGWRFGRKKTVPKKAEEENGRKQKKWIKLGFLEENGMGRPYIFRLLI